MSITDLQEEGHKMEMVITAKMEREVIPLLTIFSSNVGNKLIFSWSTGEDTPTYSNFAFTFDKNDVKKVVPNKEPQYQDDRYEYQITGLESVKKGYNEPSPGKKVTKHFKIFWADNRDRFTEINELITGGKEIPVINNLTDGYEVIVKNLVVHKKKDIRRGYSKHKITISSTITI